MKKRNLKFVIIPFIILIIITGGNFFLKNKKSNMYADSNSFPDSETLTVNFSDIPQIPWNAFGGSSTYIVETFASAVYGNLTGIKELESGDNLNENILLEKYGCDKKNCYLKLNKNIKFHNGREVNAYDVEFSFIRPFLNLNMREFSINALENIEGSQEFFSKHINIKSYPKKKFENINYLSGLVKGIKIVDKYNLIIKLTRENKFIFHKLSTGFLPIIPIEEFKDDFKTWKYYPIGFGKYRVVKGDLATHEFVVKRVIDKEDIPKFVRFIFSDKNIGDIRVLQDMKKISEGEESFISPNIYSNGGFLFNFRTKLGADINFRKAISLAIDRDKVVSSSPHGVLVPDDQLLPNYGWLRDYRADIPIQKMDLKLAKKYLSKVPTDLWKNRVFEVHVFWFPGKNLYQLPYMVEIASELENLGIKVKFLDIDPNYKSTTDQNVLYWNGFDQESGNPNTNFALFRKGSYYKNFYPENNTEFNILYNDSVKNLNITKDSTKKLSQYFTDNCFMVIVFSIRKILAFKKDRIELLGEQNSGVKLEVSKIKIKNQ